MCVNSGLRNSMLQYERIGRAVKDSAFMTKDLDFSN